MSFAINAALKCQAQPANQNRGWVASRAALITDIYSQIYQLPEEHIFSIFIQHVKGYTLRITVPQ